MTADRDDHLLAGLRAVARSLDDAAPPITTPGAAPPAADRRPLLALVAAFVLVAGVGAWLLVDRGGDDDSVVTPGPTASTVPQEALPDAGFAVRTGDTSWELYGYDGRRIGSAPGPDDHDPGAPLQLTPARDRLGVLPASLPGVSDACTAVTGGDDVWVGLCGLDGTGRPRELHVVRQGRDEGVLTGPPPDPGAPTVLGFWRWAWVSPDGRWVLAQWSGECESRTAFILPSDGSTELQTVTGGVGDAWLSGPESAALGWAPDGRAVIQIPGMDCGGPQADAGVYLLDPTTGERELVRAAAVPDGQEVSTEEVALWTLERPETLEHDEVEELPAPTQFGG